MAERRATFTVCCARDDESGLIQVGVFEGHGAPRMENMLVMNGGYTLDEALTVAVQEAVESIVAATKRKRPKDYRAADAKGARG